MKTTSDASGAVGAMESINGSGLVHMLARYVIADIEDAIAKVEAMLADAVDPAAEPADADTDQLELRELAEAIVVGAWLNRDNPSWNPADPTTHRPAKNDPLLAILDASYGASGEE